MERLTERLDGDGLCYGKVDCEDNCTYCDRFLKVLDKLATYEDAEEQGLLLRLPCKVGTTVYAIYGNKVTKGALIRQSSISFLDDFGKTVFLTKEEAEQALAEMKGVQE